MVVISFSIHPSSLFNLKKYLDFFKNHFSIKPKSEKIINFEPSNKNT